MIRKTALGLAAAAALAATAGTAATSSADAGIRFYVGAPYYGGYYCDYYYGCPGGFYGYRYYGGHKHWNYHHKHWKHWKHHKKH